MQNNNTATTSKTHRKRKLWVAVIGAFIASVMGITFGLCFWSGEKIVSVYVNTQGSATVSAAHSNLVGNDIINKINAGQFSNGDTIDYTYNGSYRTVTLPIGTYKFEVWGARGGSYAPGGGGGGRGGYAYGQVTYTSQTTIYIYCGGKGTDAANKIDSGGDSISYAGGYNGGGNGRGYGGAGGGGATDIRTTAGADSNSTSYNTRILVAGGGGGGNGGTSVTETYVGTSSRRSSVVYWIGESGCMQRHSSSWPNDEGGGGGGYHGGAAGHGDDPKNSYAGENYINTGVFSDSSKRGSSYGNGDATSNGKARITAVSINKAPTTRNATFNAANKGIMKRGITGSVTINASEIASDPEGTNLYFTNGNVSGGGYDILNTNNDQSLFLDSGCTISASKYFSWNWKSDNSGFNLTSVKMYPRSGYDGCTSNGTITVYAKVRDSFSGGSYQRGVTTIAFNITVPVNVIGERSGSSGTINIGADTTAGLYANTLYLGRSSTTDATVDRTATVIYNPTLNKYTAVFKEPLRYRAPVKISASDLAIGDLSGAIRSGDKFVVALPNTTAISGSNRKFLIREYDSGSRTTAYYSNRSAIANAFETLTFECLTPDPAYQVFSVKVYQVENNTAYGANTYTVPDISELNVDIVFKMDNTRPVLKDASNSAPVITVDTLGATVSKNLNDFYSDRDANPISTASHQIKNVVVAMREYVQTNKYGEFTSVANASGANANKSYFNVVPAAVSPTMYDNVTSTGMLNGNEYSTGFENWYITDSSSSTAFIKYSFSGITLNITGLRATYNMYNSARTSARAITGGTVSSATITSNGVLNAGHFYILIQVQDKNDTADTGIWLPVGIQVNNKKPHSLATERGSTGAGALPTAEGNVGETVFFSPMGITVNQSTTAIGYYNANDGRTDDGTPTGTPVAAQYASTGLFPLASDDDNFYTANMLNGSDIGSVTGGANPTGKLNELLDIADDWSAQSTKQSVTDNTTAAYFDVTPIDIFVPKTYFGKRVPVPTDSSKLQTISINGNNVECVKIKGLKVTLTGWTHNRYLHAKVKIKDSQNETAEVYIAVKVSNAVPTVTNKVATIDYQTEGRTYKSAYDITGSVPTITYRVPTNTTFFVTPYDILTDSNMLTTRFPANGFTINGLSGAYQNGTFTVGGTVGDTVRAVATAPNSYDYGGNAYISSLTNALDDLKKTRTFVALSATNRFTENVPSDKSTNLDRLYFERNTDSANLDGFTFNPYGISDPAARNADFPDPDIVRSNNITYKFGSRLMLNGTAYDLDFFMISTVHRTTSDAPVEIMLNVRDRMGAGTVGGVKTIKVIVDIINSSPRVNNPNAVYTLKVDSVSTGSVTYVTTKTINATSSGPDSFLVDNEDSNLMFYAALGCQVIDKNGKYTDTGDDGTGNRFGERYLRATITADTLTITALNSTQAIEELYVRFYATDGRYDSNGVLEYSTCRIRVQVLNSSIKNNLGENGFTQIIDSANGNVITDNVWTVESVNPSDVTKARYYTSSAVAEEKLRQNYSASSAQIKRAAIDPDGLQGLILSPASAPAHSDDSKRGYTNATIADDADDATKLDAYRNAVPQLGTSYGSKYAAIIELGVNGGGTGTGGISDYVDFASSDILYFVDGEVYSAKELSSGTFSGGKSDPLADSAKLGKFFDSRGRWIVKDFAVRVTPKKETTASEYIRIKLLLRDETKYGGGTAGLRTAYNAAQQDTQHGQSCIVEELKVLDYALFINGLGIVPYTYYNQFDGYYTVTADTGNVYVPTYDGKVSSVYGDSSLGNLYINNNAISTASGTKIKDRGLNIEDRTDAGPHSGKIFDRTSTDYNAEYKYDVIYNDGAGATGTVKESAFRYSDTIRIGSDNTYIPMSYFGLSQSLVNITTTGVVSFPDNMYVSYDLPDSAGYLRSTGFTLGAVTISDGTTVWKGGNISQNPYVTISGYDYSGQTGNSTYTNIVGTSPYYNKCLSIVTTQEGKVGSVLSGSEAASKGNHNNVVGDGNVMYLAGQKTLLQENLFGIRLSKKDARANASTLTISINIAKCQDGASGTVVAYTSENKTKNTATVTFKLEIENSPIKLTQTANGASTDNNKGYYTALSLTVGGGSKTVSLSRSAATAPASDVKLIYEDGDTAYKRNDSGALVDASNNEISADSPKKVVEESRSDKAKFYLDSTKRLSKWGSAAAAARVLATSDTSGSLKFTNTHATDAYAQASMFNYFGTSALSGMSGKDTRYVPNGGKYGSVSSGEPVEGYSKYFNVELNDDGNKLTIVPLAKTTVNTAMVEGNITSFYNDRGLVYTQHGGYYPLKVLIYDDHGDGVEQGSYVAIEIRISIAPAAPVLSPSLDKHLSGGIQDGRKISISLPVSQTYSFQIKDLLICDSFLKKDSGGNIFWQSDYDQLKAKANRSDDETFKLETGTYLQSPFTGFTGVPNNTQLLAGSASFSSNQSSGYGIDPSTQADVVMYMAYKPNGYVSGNRGPLIAGCVPDGYGITIAVNRRTTTRINGTTEQRSNFVFKLKFTDNDGRIATAYDEHGAAAGTTLFVEVNVENQLPTIIGEAVKIGEDGITMRVGDSFTVLTTPYDKFIGSESGGVSSADMSESYRNSTTYQRISNSSSGVNEKNLYSSQAGAVKHNSLTKANLFGNGAIYALGSADTSSQANRHLGYLAIANDDTPWSLRIVDNGVKYGDNTCFNTAMYRDMVYKEGSSDSSGGSYALDVIITAAKVCNRVPVSITVDDGEGGRLTYTIFITVESSKPHTFDGNNNTSRHTALTYAGTTGVYKMYMVASSATVGSATSGYLSAVKLSDGTTPHVYGEVELPINKIAYDPDAGDNKEIRLYKGDGSFNVFVMNNVAMTKKTNDSGFYTYTDGYYEITVPTNYKSFKIRCLSYNPNRDEDILQFYISDCGNDIYENAIPVTIKISSLYSSMLNEHQTSGGKITNQTIGAGAVDTVYVKSYDDYNGISASLPTDATERNKIVGNDSRYAFLSYAGMPQEFASVDQESSTAQGIYDPDVQTESDNTRNIKYELRVFAFLKAKESGGYEPMSVAEISALFALDSTNVSQKYLHLKSTALTDPITSVTSANRYFLGGNYVNGASIGGANQALALFIQQYFVFNVGANGVSLTFRPVTSNINFDIPFYVELTKDTGAGRRIANVTFDGVSATCGTLFNVKVKNSAPIANTKANVLSFTGKINESAVFKIHDIADTDNSLFSDSDIEDVVEIKSSGAEFTRSELNDALATATCNWQAATGKHNAIKIEVNNTDAMRSGVPAHSVKVTILRRIDVYDSTTGKYASEVPLPVILKGRDRAKQIEVPVQLNIVVSNSDVNLKAEKVATIVTPDDKNGYYQLSKDSSGAVGTKRYFLDAYIVPNRPLAPFSFTVGDYIDDNDYVLNDNDSLRLVAEEGLANSDKYLRYGSDLKVRSEQEGKDVATVKPIFGTCPDTNAATKHDAKYHFTGFSITVDSYNRNISDMVAYMRVLDRSGNESDPTAGFTVTLRIHILNAPPELLQGKKRDHILVGSETKDGTPIVIDINDYVVDQNHDRVRIVGVAPIINDSLADGEIDPNLHCTLDADNDGEIVSINVSADGQKVTFTPRKGFYGVQSLNIVVADGDLASGESVGVTQFRQNLTIVYDINQMPTLNSLTAIRSLPTKVTPQKLFRDIVDKYGTADKDGDDAAASGALTSAAPARAFNPGANYVITELSALGALITRDANNDWQFVCNRETPEILFNVTFKYAGQENDENAERFPMTFTASVGKNSAPTLLESFKGDGYLFQTGSGELGLDNNGRVMLTPSMLFHDVDIINGDSLKFDKASAAVVSGTMCQVQVTDDGMLMYLTFNCRGETELTVGIADRTGEVTKYTIKIKNIDRPEPSFWDSIMISYETNPIMWWAIGIGVVVLIALLILLILLLKRRKRKREELEAILISEMELEEQMMRLSGGIGSPQYQSYGFLPPSMPVQNDPGLMLGSGSNAPNPTNAAFGLNPGQNHGVPTDSDM